MCEKLKSHNYRLFVLISWNYFSFIIIIEYISKPGYNLTSRMTIIYNILVEYKIEMIYHNNMLPQHFKYYQNKTKYYFLIGT